MKRRNFLMTSATLVAAGILTRVDFVDQAHAEGPLKVGVLVPMSGPAGLFGPSSKNCAQMAVDKINAEGGIFGRIIEPIYTDVGVPPAEAAQAVLKVWKRQGAEAFVA